MGTHTLMNDGTTVLSFRCSFHSQELGQNEIAIDWDVGVIQNEFK